MRATNPSPVADTPYVYVEYPKVLYHKAQAPTGRTVQNAEEQAALGEGWVDTPAAFDPSYVPPPKAAPAVTVADAEKIAAENAALKQQLADMQKAAATSPAKK